MEDITINSVRLNADYINSSSIAILVLRRAPDLGTENLPTSEEEAHACDYCDKEFNLKTSLQTHIHTQHNNVAVSTPMSSITDGFFKCNKCDYKQRKKCLVIRHYSLVDLIPCKYC